jgi:hypothetical protein
MSAKQDYKVLAEMDYELGQVERGYTNRTLYVNLSDNTIASKPVTLWSRRWDHSIPWFRQISSGQPFPHHPLGDR